MAKLTNIIIHCSDSAFGTAAEIRRWHLANGWADIGYHFVILNGVLVPFRPAYDPAKDIKKLFIPSLDGSIEVGRRIDGDGFIDDNEAGAHTLGYNDKSIGICLIGRKIFSQKQLHSLAKLLVELMQIYGIDRKQIMGHYQVSNTRTCPNLNVPAFLDDLQQITMGSWEEVDPAIYELKLNK